MKKNTSIIGHNTTITDQYLIDLIQYIEMNVSKSYTVKTMARDLSLSERHIYNLFKKHLGVTPSKYINESKLNYAKRLLVTSNLPVHEIALMCGYENSTYFITLFKKNFGKTPLQYRIDVL